MVRTLDAEEILRDGVVTFFGVPGSPYTRKMAAVLRYRRIPYRMVLGSQVTGNIPMAKPPLLPTFLLPGSDGRLEAVTDSTPLIDRFEREVAHRSVRPVDPALKVIDLLIEDYADEWLTKAMFHYRWAYAADIDKASRVLPTWSRKPMSDEELAAAGAMVSSRQIPRLRYVGSNETTGPIIEASYHRYLDIFEEHLKSHRYCLGARPGGSDFGMFGQLTQLAHFDPTSMAVTMERAPRVYGYTGSVEDLSGLEPEDSDWVEMSDLPSTLLALIAEIGRVYVPLLLANERAIRSGASEVDTVIDGARWTQQPFAYQVKCLGWLRASRDTLSPDDRQRLDRVLRETGCDALFQS
ncbi:MAG: glutathione S-transferase C-terminal domain-containing protein [Alphaproteobacteria bacterium]|nr:glutathione S-transferase C-terminal domain-containing protein [Alphaproteobacteria bacterium]